MPPNRKKSQVRRIETSGIPHRDTSPALSKKFAEHLGIIAPTERTPQPLPEQHFTEVKLGNPDLPVYEHLDTIVQTIDDNPVTICVAETGSGKSTQIPQALLQRGYKVVLTQPRRIAAEMLASRIADEISEDDKLGRYGRMAVGFQTAERSTLTEDTRISVVTDGLRLVQELGLVDEDDRDEEPEVLIIDEVHERNTNIDALIAWTQRLVAKNSNLRVVFTTASINAERLARHYDKVQRTPTPIIEIPGRNHAIEKLERPDSTVAEEVAKLAKEGSSVLVFLPGLTEIDDAISATQRLLKGERNNYTYQRLHGKISPREQRQIEEEVDGVRLVFATNVAETSITIPDVDAVVDSGLERRIEINEEGDESLRVEPVSRASCLQRAGRCGRTKEGLYILTRLNKRVRYVSILDRDEYTKPEILRSNVDKTVLKVASAGLDITDLDWLDNIKHETIMRSKKALQILGALDEHYKITDRGRRMNDFPVRPSLSRMMVYALENNFSEETRRYIAAMAAAVEGGGLPDYTSDSSKGWKKLLGNRQSDLLGQLDMFIASQDMQRYQIRDNDLNERAITRARELYDKLLRRSNMRPGVQLMPPSEDQYSQIVEAIAAGMIDFVYKRSGSEYIRTSHMIGRAATKRATKKPPTPRSISDRSIMKGRRGPDLVVANPYALAPPPGKEKLPENYIIQDISEVTPAILAKVALELCEWEEKGELVWRDGVPHVVQRQTFRGTIDTGVMREQPAQWNRGLAEEIIGMAYKQPGRNLRQILNMKKQSEQLWHRSGAITPIHQNQIDEVMKTVSGISKSSLQKKPVNPATLDIALQPHVERFESLLPTKAEQERIMQASPDYVDFEGISLHIQYSKGVPYVSRITDSIKLALLATNGDLTLPDGRDILIPHKLGRSNKRYTITEFRRLG